jgi:hypothetical protein
MTPDLVRRPPVVGRDGLGASDLDGGGAALISTGSKIEPSLPAGFAVRHAVPSSDLAHRSPRHQRLFDDPRLLVLAPAPSASTPRTFPSVSA